MTTVIPQTGFNAQGGPATSRLDVAGAIDAEVTRAMAAEAALATGSSLAPVNQLGIIVTPSLTVDVTKSRSNTMTLSTNLSSFAVTVSLPTSPAIFFSVLFAITQDATGTRTIAWPANFHWQGGFSPALSTQPGATDVIQLISFNTGVTWLAAVAMNLPPT